MKHILDSMLRRYGTRVEITGDGGTKTVLGFFHPVTSTSQQSMQKEATPLGTLSQGQYTYIGPADTPIREGDMLHVGGKQYLLRRCEVYIYQDQPLYQWGLCMERSNTETWPTST